MLKLNNVNKYFNKGKENEIHVINNTTLEFPKSGLISLLGESGSGKTTLLNVIGGLDKASGQITFKDETLNIYKDKKWDDIRVSNIGYIFQNYYLLENKTINENIHIVLNMMGINDYEEVKYRTEYVLKAVGMFRFRNKLASDLSGGQKQRVAIARAIVKNPDIIIADEPTGNLDTNNSVEVLNIIKEISKEKLVILVTHNKQLAYNYSDRIINIKDGLVVSDKLNETKETNLSYIDNNIYLKDLNKAKTNQIEIYTNDNIENVNFKIIKINNNYYLETNDKNATIEIINNSSNIKILNKSKSDLKDKDYEKTSFSLKDLEKKQTEIKKSNIYTFKDSLIEAFKKLSNLGRKGKLQIVGLIYLGVSFTIAFLMLMSAITIDYNSIDFDKDLYQINAEYSGDFKIPEEAILSSNYIYSYLNKGSFSVQMQDQKILPKEAINKENTNENLVYIDSSVLDKNYPYKIDFESFGILKEKHLKNQTVTVNNYELIIEDTVKTNTKSIYIDKDILLETVIRNYNNRDVDLKLFNKSTETSNKEFDLNIDQSNGKFEVYINENIPNDELENFVSDLNFYEYKVVGFFKSSNENYEVLIKEDQFKLKVEHDFNNFKYGTNLLFYIKEYNNKDNMFINIREQSIKEMKDERKLLMASSITQTLVAISLTVLIFYFLVRSSLTSRRKEISILRSLGISKKEVRRLFMIEYAILTTFTSLIGVLIGVIISNYISGSFLSDFFTLRTSPFSIVLTVILIYIINIFISLIPVNLMLNKTPAELLTNYDI